MNKIYPHWPLIKPIVTTVLAALPLLMPFSASGMNHGHISEWQQWPVVGEAKLSWFVFDIYQSRLRTPDGRYLQSQDIPPHSLVLEIHYLRDITRQQLLEATDEQWQALNLNQQMRAEWLAELAVVFPDISSGDRLAYKTDGQEGQFYYAVGPDWKPIGVIDDHKLNNAFLSIWLSPDTSYPDLRRDLIGYAE
jgi:hypothetical protein